MAFSENNFDALRDRHAMLCMGAHAAEQGIAEEEALKQGMEAKSKEFVEKGAEVYAKA